MHPYSTDATRPVRAMLVLAVAAVLLALLFSRTLAALALTAPWWLDTPAVLGFYGLLWRTYDRLLWKLRVNGWTLSGIPDIAGVWVGEVVSNFDRTRRLPARLTIRQTSSRMLIELHTDTSASHSTMAALCTQPGPAQGLRYSYANLPGPFADDPLRPHSGVSRLVLSDDGRSLDGEYQNDRFRGTFGALSFRREGAVRQRRTTGTVTS